MPTPEPVETKRAPTAQEAQRDAQEAASDLAWLMSDKRGRRFMWRLLANLGVYQQTLDPTNPEQTHATAFREGRRSVGLMLIGRLNQACADRMSEMQKEVQAHVRPDSSTSSR